MGDWIGLGIIVLVVVGALVGMSYLGRKPKPITAEEYERRVAEAKGTTRAAAMAGVGGLEKFINPGAAKAVEVQKDLKAGYYNDEQKKGEGDGEDGVGEPLPEEDALKPKDEEDEEGKDA